MFWIFTFFGNSELGVHPHPYVNFFILSLNLLLTVSLTSHPPIIPSPISPILSSILLIPHSTFHIIPSLSLFPLNTYPQLIHNSHASYPQLFHSLSTTPILLIDLSSTPIFPLLLLFLQSSPLYFPLIPHPKLSTGTLSYPQVIHNLV